MLMLRLLNQQQGAGGGLLDAFKNLSIIPELPIFSTYFSEGFEEWVPIPVMEPWDPMGPAFASRDRLLSDKI